MSLSVEQKLAKHELLGRSALACYECGLPMLEAGLTASGSLSMRSGCHHPNGRQNGTVMSPG